MAYDIYSCVALTWRILYIGQASDPQYDQVLEEAEMDCSNPGQMKFVFEVSNQSEILQFYFIVSLTFCN